MSTSATSTDFAATIAHHSKSFSMAARLLPPAGRDDARVLYAWCRRADDAVDDGDPATAPERLVALRSELDAVFAGEATSDAVVDAFAEVVRRRAIPRHYPDALLDGMEMDVTGARYDTLEDVLGYGYRVASTVGLMMCHALGVRDDDALLPAAHLGIAMQLTNIARDVAEDWERGRIYLPATLLTEAGAPPLQTGPGRRWPAEATAAAASVIARLLDVADAFYRSGDRGLRALDRRSGFAVRVARLVYSRIGAVVRRRGCDPTTGRAYVSKARKIGLVLRAAWSTVVGLFRSAGGPTRPPRRVLPLSAAVLAIPFVEVTRAARSAALAAPPPGEVR